MKLPYAEDINYFKTGKSSPDKWIESTRREIETAGGKWKMNAFGVDSNSGKAAFMVQFELEGKLFKICWPVLSVYSDKDQKAARTQAATLLYHDVKAMCMKAKVFGAQQAFFQHLMLPDGKTVGQLADDEIEKILPDIFILNKMLPEAREEKNASK